MSFLANIIVGLLTKLGQWLGKLLVSEIKKQAQEKEADSKAAEHAKEIEGSKDEQERRKRVEDMLNGN